MVKSINNIPDWEMRIRRQDAALKGEIIDRPVVLMTCPKPGAKEFPKKVHKSLKERWFDSEYQAKKARHSCESTLYFGDALPVVWPDVGPDFFPALFGGQIEFEENTSYVKPWLAEWEDWDRCVKYAPQNNEYFKIMEHHYEAYLKECEGVAYVGYPDLHPGSDCLVGMRGPMNMNIDVLEEPEAIAQRLKEIGPCFFETFEHYYKKLNDAGQPCCNWSGIVSNYKYHVPSSDFSYMISPNSFDELFLEGLREENNYFESNIHHLDGPGCANHLNSLLGIESLDMIQWVWGAGNGRATDYLELYKKIQSAKKGIQTWVDVDEVDTIISHLNPEGVWLKVNISSPDQADLVMKKINSWTNKK
jgi:hypothetical protein